MASGGQSPAVEEDDRTKIHRLFQSITYNDVDTFKQLLKNTSVNVRDERGYTLLHLAAVDEEEAIAELIMSHKDFDYTSSADNETGQSVVHECVKNKALKVCMKFHQRFPDHLNQGNINGETPLHMLASNYNENMLRWFIEAKANLNSLDNARRTPLMAAITHHSIEMQNTLIGQGASISHPAEYLSINSPMHCAIQAQNNSAASKLVESEAQVEFTATLSLTKTIKGSSARHSADPFLLNIPCENLSTLVLKRLSLQTERLYEATLVAETVLQASTAPPDEEAMFEFFATYFYDTGNGLSRVQRAKVRRGQYRRLPRMTKIWLLRTFALALSLTNGSLRNKEKLRRRFKFDDDTFDGLVNLYTESSLLKISALTARKLMVQAGQHSNATTAMSDTTIFNTSPRSSKEFAKLKPFTNHYMEELKALVSGSQRN